MSRTLVNASGCSLCAGAELPTPALFTSTCTSPNASTPAATRASQSAGWDTSVDTAMHRRPRASTLPLVSSSRSARRAPSTRSAPASASASAKVTPSPEDAPVTTATRPSSRNWSSTLMTAPPPSLTAELRLAAFLERLAAFGHVGGGEDRGHQVLALAVVDAGLLVQRPLGRRDGERCALGHARGQGGVLGDQLVVGHHLVDEAELPGLLRAEVVGGEGHPGHPAAADHVDAAGHRDGGEQAVVHLAEAEARLLGGDDEVARQRDLGAEAEGVAVHRGDDDLGHPLDGLERRVGLPDEPIAVAHAVEGHPAEVGAGREGLAVAAGEDDGADLVVALERGDRLGQL